MGHGKVTRLKAGAFVVEGLHGFATAYYFYYLFFYMTETYGFGDKGNLFLACLNGFVYVPGSWFGGRFAQRRGPFTALKLGFSLICTAMILGWIAPVAWVQLAVNCLWTMGVCFIWPTLEGLASHGESPRGIQRMVGIYNLTWSSATALAFFSGGTIWGHLGKQSIFWFPLLIHLTQLVIVFVLEKEAARTPAVETVPVEEEAVAELNPRPIAKARLFLQMAWTANAFAFMAINAILPVIPTVAKRFNLTKASVGIIASIWLFSRFFAFFILWIWPGWHYRFRWFISAYVGVMLGFAGILLLPNLAGLIASQAVFGISLGLIYYSSLFYSMDASSEQSEHGGVHESALGGGIFMGPATGASALYFWPQHSHAAAYAVLVLLLIGFATLIFLRQKSGVKS